MAVEFHFEGGAEAIEREIRREASNRSVADEIGEKLHGLMEQGMKYAQSISPVDTGKFRDSWSVEDVEPHEGDLPSSQLQNSDEGAVPIEYGSVRSAPHHVLASTYSYMEQAGKDREIHI